MHNCLLGKFYYSNKFRLDHRSCLQTKWIIYKEKNGLQNGCAQINHTRMLICKRSLPMNGEVTKKTKTFENIHRAERSSRGQEREERQTQGRIAGRDKRSSRYILDERSLSRWKCSLESIRGSRFLLAPFIRLPISWRLPRNLLSPLLAPLFFFILPDTKSRWLDRRQNSSSNLKVPFRRLSWQRRHDVIATHMLTS